LPTNEGFQVKARRLPANIPPRLLATKFALQGIKMPENGLDSEKYTPPSIF